MALPELSQSELASKVTHPGVLGGKLSTPYTSVDWHNPPAQFSEVISPVVAYISRSLRSDQAWTLEGVRFNTWGEAGIEGGELGLVYKTGNEPPIFKTGFLGHKRHLNLNEIFDSSIRLNDDHHLRQGAVYKRSSEVLFRFPIELLTPEQIQTGNITRGSLGWSYEVRVKPFILTNMKASLIAAEDPTRVRFNITIIDALLKNNEAQRDAEGEWENKRTKLEETLSETRQRFHASSERNARILTELVKLPKPPLQLIN